MISGVRSRFAGSALGVVTSWSGGWAVAACTSGEMYVGRFFFGWRSRSVPHTT